MATFVEVRVLIEDARNRNDTYMNTKKTSLKEKYRAFRAWQKRPYRVAPMSEKEHDCFTCHTHFQGNFCPRCGQSANIGRYSLKDTTIQFFEVWGVGNRSFFRCLRDLILRPGYMIRDYLSGMQMAYYPPFQLLSTIAALHFLIGMFEANIHSTATDAAVTTSVQQSLRVNEDTTLATTKQADTDKMVESMDKIVNDWIPHIRDNYPTVFPLYLIIFHALSFYLFYRKSKKIPNLRLSEALIVAVYCTCIWLMCNTAISILFLIAHYLGADTSVRSIASASSRILPFIVLSILVFIIPLKQLFGGSWVRAYLSIQVSYIFCLVISFILMGIIAYSMASF